MIASIYPTVESQVGDRLQKYMENVVTYRFIGMITCTKVLIRFLV